MNVMIRTPLVITNGQMSISLNSENKIKSIDSNGIKIPLFNEFGEGVNLTDIFVRIRDDNGCYFVCSLMNSESCAFTSSEEMFYWTTLFSGLKIDLSIILAESSPKYFINIKVTNTTKNTLSYDITYGQDLSLSDIDSSPSKATIFSKNIEHTANETEFGWVVNSRQTLPRNGKKPGLRIGSFGVIESFCTDFIPFFGKQFNLDGKVNALNYPTLPNNLSENEMGYVALKTQMTNLKGNRSSYTVFHGTFIDDMFI